MRHKQLDFEGDADPDQRIFLQYICICLCLVHNQNMLALFVRHNAYSFSMHNHDIDFNQRLQLMLDVSTMELVTSHSVIAFYLIRFIWREHFHTGKCDD